jgi:BatD DUF11 like domain
MVNRLVFSFVLIPILWAVVSSASAASLSVEPDRNRLYEGEVLTLTVKGSMEIDLNLSNLFDFDASSLPQPDIEKVENNFEILSQNQRYSIRTVNGDMIGEVTWTYQLAPRKTGKLTIPPLEFRGAKSGPVTIEVVDGTPPEQANSARDSFIELSTNKAGVYVQEELILTVKLFFNGSMVRGELSEPSHPDAIIETLGKQTEYTRYRDGVRYRVVERRYAIFPQQPGELNIPAIRFEGQTRDAAGRLKFLRDSKELFPVPVEDIPDSFTGDTWLPATRLTLSESGLTNERVINAGQNLSRTLTVSAEGLPAAALPPFSNDTPEGIRAYPETPERTTVPTEEGLTAQLEQTVALVPVKTGDVTLPEIRIPWWDTKSDTQKMAVIPAHRFTVQPVAGQAVSPPEPAPEPSANEAAGNATTGPETLPETGTATDKAGVWKILALILLTGWIVTALIWWWRSRQTSAPADPSARAGDQSEKALFRVLWESARAGAPETSGHLVRWVQHCFPERTVVSLQEVYQLLGSEKVEREMRRLQAITFSRSGADAEQWHSEPLVTALTDCRQQMKTGPAARNPLPALYPDELNAG